MENSTNDFKKLCLSASKLDDTNLACVNGFASALLLKQNLETEKPEDAKRNK